MNGARGFLSTNEIGQQASGPKITLSLAHAPTANLNTRGQTADKPSRVALREVRSGSRYPVDGPHRCENTFATLLQVALLRNWLKCVETRSPPQIHADTCLWMNISYDSG